jgi:hypothetical protein
MPTASLVAALARYQSGLLERQDRHGQTSTASAWRVAPHGVSETLRHGLEQFYVQRITHVPPLHLTTTSVP